MKEYMPRFLESNGVLMVMHPDEGSRYRVATPTEVWLLKELRSERDRIIGLLKAASL